MGALNLSAGPSGYPVTLQELKDHLRMSDITDFDVQLNNLIKEGTSYAEDFTGQRLITQTWTYKLDSFSSTIKMPYYPLQSVSSIQYQDDNNATQTLSSAYYVVDSNSRPGRIELAHNYTYPTTYSTPNAVTITFICGYGAASAVPERFKTVIKMYAQAMFEMNEMALEIADRLIGQDRISWLALSN